MRTLERALSILGCFAPDNCELGTTQVASKTGIPKATAYRMLSILAKYGILEQNEKTKNYRIGPQLYVLGTVYLNKTNIITAAEPVTKILNDLTGETVHVSIFTGGNVLIIMREESKHTFRVNQHIGSIVPPHTSAMGKAFLSELSDAELDELLLAEKLAAITPKSITSKTELKRELEQIRKNGVAIDNEGTLEAIIGTGALIRNETGRAVAAIGMPFPIFRLKHTQIERILDLVRMGAQLISYRLGYQDVTIIVRSPEELRAYWESGLLAGRR